MKKQKVFIPLSVEGELPPFKDDILVSFDGGITYPESAAYRSNRRCMLAGAGGGNGYFGKGFCTNGSTGCDDGLILSDITHWLKELEGYFLSIDELNNMLRDAFNAGSKWGKAAVGEFYGGSENENKDCIDYIESLY